MDNDTFNVSPFSKTLFSIFPGDKGILLFYNNGDMEEIYGKEHVMMMQDIGYWYIDNWQDFLLNYAYNNIIVVMIEFDTSLVYLPKKISNEQKNTLINYIDKNVSEDNKKLLHFYIMHCIDSNSNCNDNEIRRDKRGMIKHISGIDITGSKPIGCEELYNYLNINDYEKYKILKNNSLK